MAIAVTVDFRVRCSINYRKRAPPKSYIHADDFESPQQLAKHLKKVAANTTLYHKYHEWRKCFDAEFRLTSADPNWLCHPYKKIHMSPPKTVDVYKHFSEDTGCNVADRNRNKTFEHLQYIVNYNPLPKGSHPKAPAPKKKRKSGQSNLYQKYLKLTTFFGIIMYCIMLKRVLNL